MVTLPLRHMAQHGAPDPGANTERACYCRGPGEGAIRRGTVAVGARVRPRLGRTALDAARRGRVRDRAASGAHRNTGAGNASQLAMVIHV
jgi:hypothetical protein